MNLIVAALATATSIAGVAADFQIYWVEQVVANPAGDENTVSSIMIFDGEPSCDDVNTGYAALPVVADASSVGYSRCEGCGDYGDIDDWDITQLEMHAHNPWGHYTIYGPDFFIVPAVGGDNEGSCTRDNGDDFSCSTGLDFSKGNRLFTCTSNKEGYHAE